MQSQQSHVNTKAIRVAVLMTCHNRRDTTLSCLDALAPAVAEAAEVQVYLVDDGSTDGTAEAVAKHHPEVRVIPGDGSLYWNRGMRRAWEHAASDRPDYFLWLNDDTILYPHAIQGLLELHLAGGNARTIVVGHTVDPSTGNLTYGGYVRMDNSLSRLRFRRPSYPYEPCACMNGNCVLLPLIALDEIGMNDLTFRHAFGDNDYGLRASRSGYQITQYTQPVASQRRNEEYENRTSYLGHDNWRYILFHPKGVPVREWLHFCRRHGGRLWPVNFLYRYIKMMLSPRRRKEIL